MSSVKYEFRYMPLIGKLSGESMLQQTEQAINEIAEIVNENTAQADIINTLAQDANDNSVEALEKANEALETSSRVYIHESLAVNLDSYCESQLIYVANISSTNLPIAKKGFLEVKTDDDKTECVQLFVSDDKDVYVRSGSITAETVGDITVYTADFEEWTSLSSPTILLQAGNGTSIPLSADLNDYNTEGTFYCSTTNVGSIAHCPVSEGEFKLIVMKFATANYGLQMLYPSGQHLYVRKYSGGAWGNWEVIVPKITSGVTNGSIAVNDTDVPVTGWTTKADLDSPVFVGTPTAPTPTASDDSTKIATTEFVHDNTDNKLPLTGGTMTGGITATTGDFLKRDVDSGILRIMGGSSATGGAFLLMYGKNYSAPGRFTLRAFDGTNTSDLMGQPNGTLTWGGYNVITSAGGTMTGTIETASNLAIKRSVNNGYLQFNSGSETADGCSLILCGKNYTGTYGGGSFAFIARNDNDGYKIFTGKPNGTLTWGGNNVLTASNYNNYALPLSGGTMSGTITESAGIFVKRNVDNSFIAIYGGTGDNKGSYLSLSGKDRSINAGGFSLVANDGSNNLSFFGSPDGTLKWGGKILSAPSGRILTASGTVAAVQNSFVDITSVVLDKSISDKWFVFVHVKISESVNSIISMTLGESSSSAVRFNGSSGGGAVNGIVQDITSNTTYKLSAYTSASTQFNYTGKMWAIPLM